MIHMECPQCGKELHIDEKYAGQLGRCQYCQEEITVPITGGWEPTQPPPAEVILEKPMSLPPVVQKTEGIKIRNPIGHGFGFGCGIVLLLLFIFVVIPVGFVIISALGLFVVIDQELESNEVESIAVPVSLPNTRRARPTPDEVLSESEAGKIDRPEQ